MLVCKVFLLAIILYLITSIEGYQNNKPPPDRPDELQFLACSDNNIVDFGNREIEFVGNNNYKLKQHHIGQPLVGTYTSFIDTYGIRNYDEFFHAPICEENYNFESIGANLGFREIADTTTNSNLMDQTDVLKEEVELDKFTVRDPNYLYVNPEYIGNKLLYSNEIQKKMIKNHKSHDTENLQHRLDNSLYDSYL